MANGVLGFSERRKAVLADLEKWRGHWQD